MMQLAAPEIHAHASGNGDALLRVDELLVCYSRGRRLSPLRAVDDVSFSLAPRETLAIVGESGSGKTTIGKAILGLAPVTQGSIMLAGEDITRAPYRRRRSLSADIQAIFQDPYSSLNPARTVGQTLEETFRVHAKQSSAAVKERVREILVQVGLSGDSGSRYPAHFSGGQRQRIAIARALIGRPRLVVCDEPTSALDLSIQAQVLNLLTEMQEALELSYLFISHDLAVVRHISDRILVLYQGRVMEQGDAELVCTQPVHPYTRTLFDSTPVPDPVEHRARRARRSMPRDMTPVRAEACPFAPRCTHAVDVCREKRPHLESTPDGSSVACHRWREIGTKS